MIPIITTIFAARRNTANVRTAQIVAEQLGKRTILIRPAPVFVETWQALCWCPRHLS